MAEDGEKFVALKMTVVPTNSTGPLSVSIVQNNSLNLCNYNIVMSLYDFKTKET
jgi:hypothetical protein